MGRLMDSLFVWAMSWFETPWYTTVGYGMRQSVENYGYYDNLIDQLCEIIIEI
jgi:hypothetical protein